MSVKSNLYRLCLEYINKRIGSIQETIKQSQESADEETKSSAGDKYETGRSMMQLDMEQHAARLADALKTRDELEKIGTIQNVDVIMPGSLVTTDQNRYYISLSAGKIDFEGKAYFCVSASSPVGAKLIGLKKGDEFTLNNLTQRIDEID
jgi:transcription elongation GreA/GreB family factor